MNRFRCELRACDNPVRQGFAFVWMLKTTMLLVHHGLLHFLTSSKNTWMNFDSLIKRLLLQQLSARAPETHGCPAIPPCSDGHITPFPSQPGPLSAFPAMFYGTLLFELLKFLR
jgi:hypothetical protein